MSDPPYVTENVVLDTLEPDVAWIFNPGAQTSDDGGQAMCAWGDANGLDAHQIPFRWGALTIRLATPDGGLIAHVEEVARDDEGRVVWHHDTLQPATTERDVPVRSIPPVYGLIPKWAARMTDRPQEKR